MTTAELELLDNLFWHALAGPQAHFAVGTGQARRFAPGFSPIVGFADPRQPRLADLEGCCEPGEHFYSDGWDGPAPAGWAVEQQTLMCKMAWREGMAATDLAPQARALGPGDLPQVLELVALTRPGPFGPRTLELGEYFGLFDGDGRLMAMAGERCAAGRLREVSGVCTHPDFQGRGLARRLMCKVISRQLVRGQRPVLHVMSANAGALHLYRDMGFDLRRESAVRVIARA